MHNEVIFLAAALALGGCAPMVFDKPGATQADFSEDSAKCRLVARGMNPGGFYAQGSASFVAGAAVGNAIGTAANQRATYKDCMMAAGYTVESPQVQALTLSAKPIVARLSVCFRSAYDAPAADVIRAKLVLDATKATAEQLSDPSYATGAEIAALNALHPRVKQCQQDALAALTPVAPAIVPVLSESYAAGDGYVASLEGGKISWGAFNTLRKERTAAAKDEIATILGQSANQ
jgi:hypothetical protein